MKNFKFNLISALIVLSPLTASAETRDLVGVARLITGYIDIAITLILSFAILSFVYNVYKYFISGSDDVSAKKEAGLYVMWSIIGFFVILSFWGLVNILLQSTKLNNSPANGLFGSFRSSGGGNSIFNPAPSSGTNLGGASNTGSNSLGGASNTGSNNLGGASNTGSNNLGGASNTGSNNLGGASNTGGTADFGGASNTGSTNLGGASNTGSNLGGASNTGSNLGGASNTGYDSNINP